MLHLQPSLYALGFSWFAVRVSVVPSTEVGATNISWRDDSVSEVNSIPRAKVKKPSTVLHACNPSAVEAETGGDCKRWCEARGGSYIFPHWRGQLHFFPFVLSTQSNVQSYEMLICAVLNI